MFQLSHCHKLSICLFIELIKFVKKSHLVFASSEIVISVFTGGGASYYHASEEVLCTIDSNFKGNLV